MQRLLSHAVTELGDTRRNQKISKQGTYPSYFYPKEVGEGGAVRTWPDYYLNNLYPSISRMWEVGGEPSHCNALAVYSRSWQDIFLHLVFIFILYLYFLLTQLTRYLSTSLFFIFVVFLYLIFIFSMNNLTRYLSIYSRSLSYLFIIFILWIIWQYLC